MALGNLFKLAKLTITAYKRTERDDDTDKYEDQFEVQYNPETLSTKHASVFNSCTGRTEYSRSASEELSVALVFDGTNVADFGGESVSSRISKFLQICYHKVSTAHEPAFLRLTWGAGVLRPGFDCRLKSAQINYKSFNRDGLPLHAKLSAVFLEDVDSEKKNSMERLSSPDLSHRRTVKSGDTLPLLCREIYGSGVHYLRIAEVNGLDDFRVLAPGRQLIFPPFEKGGR